MKEKEEKFLMKFAANLVAIREKKGISQRQLATLAGLDHAQISRIENHKANLTVTTLAELAEGLGVHPKKLLDF